MVLSLSLPAGNRYGSGLRCAPLYSSSRSSCQRQRSFDDTESTDGYNLPYANAMRYENIYEQIRDEPLYRSSTSGSAGSRVPLYTRLDVLGHGIGRIERHLSSSCGNIDHYNLGGHYAVLGHSHFGTVGHIRLNANGGAAAAAGAAAAGAGCTVPNCQGYVGGAMGAGTAAAAAAAATAAGIDYGNVKVPVKNSASSFFSCLHGENSQSMTNIYKTTAAAVAAAHHTSPLTPNVSMERAARSASAGPVTAAIAIAAAAEEQQLSTDSVCSSSASIRPTGAIPKVKSASKTAKESSSGSSSSSVGTAANGLEKLVGGGGTMKSAALTKKSNNAAARSNSSTDANNGTLNRISKSSLQWLLVNKWLPLWIGQGPECKVS